MKKKFLFFLSLLLCFLGEIFAETLESVVLFDDEIIRYKLLDYYCGKLTAYGNFYNDTENNRIYTNDLSDIKAEKTKCKCFLYTFYNECFCISYTKTDENLNLKYYEPKIYVLYEDNNKNLDVTSKSGKFVYIDNDAPKIKIAGNYFNTGSTINFKGDCFSIVELFSPDDSSSCITIFPDDGNGCGCEKIYLYEGDSKQETSAGFIKRFSDGIHNIKIETYDYLGNCGIYEYCLKVDNKAPDITFMNLSEESEYLTSKKIKIQAIDEVSGIAELIVKDGDVQLTGTDSEYTIDGDGTHVITVVVKDKAGNSATASKTIYIDTKAPTITVNDISEKWKQASSQEITITATDDATADKYSGLKSISVYDSITKETTSISSGSTYKVSDNGNHELTIRATDNAGNEAVKNVSVKLDLSEPVIEISDVPDNWTNTDSYEITVSAQDFVAGIKSISIYDSITKETTPISSGNKYKVSGVGNHELTIVAIDNANNKSEKKVSVKLSTASPKVTVTATEYIREDSDITIQAKDDTGIKKITVYDSYSANEKIFTYDNNNVDETYTIEGEGVHNLIVTVENTIGNKTKKEGITVILDKTCPVVSLDNRENIEGVVLSDQNSSVTVTVKDKNPNDVYVAYSTDCNNIKYNKIEISKDSNYIIKYEIDNTDLREGKNYIFFKANDEAGNESSPVRLAVYKDICKPSAPVLECDSSVVSDVGNYKETGSIARFRVIQSASPIFGVKGYYYKLFDGDTDLSSTTFTESNYKFKKASSDCSIILRDLKNSDEGKHYCLCVFTLSENGMVSEKPAVCNFTVNDSIEYNIESQSVSETLANLNGIQLELVKDEVNNYGLKVTLPYFKDIESEIDKIIISYAEYYDDKYEKTMYSIVDRASSEFTIGNINCNGNYYVKATIFDKDGNSIERDRLYKAETSVNISKIPYSYENKGLKIHGIKDDMGLTDVSLYIPDDFLLFDDDGVLLNRVDFNDVVVSSDKKYIETAQFYCKNYSAEYQGYKFNNIITIIYNNETGIHIEDSVEYISCAKLLVKYGFEDDKETVTFESFISGNQNENGTYNTCFSNKFDIKNIGALSFENDEYNFISEDLSLDVPNYMNLKYKNNDSAIVLENAYAKSDLSSSEIGGSIDCKEGMLQFIVNNGSNDTNKKLTLNIEKADFINNKIIVYEAYINLKDENSVIHYHSENSSDQSILKLENFVIKVDFCNGSSTIEEIDGLFKSDSLIITDSDDETSGIKKISIGSGCVLVKLTDETDAILTDTGIERNSYKKINLSVMKVGDFVLSDITAYQIFEKTWIESAEIKVSVKNEDENADSDIERDYISTIEAVIKDFYVEKNDENEYEIINNPTVINAAIKTDEEDFFLRRGYVFCMDSDAKFLKTDFNDENIVNGYALCVDTELRSCYVEKTVKLGKFYIFADGTIYTGSEKKTSEPYDYLSNNYFRMKISSAWYEDSEGTVYYDGAVSPYSWGENDYIPVEGGKIDPYQYLEIENEIGKRSESEYYSYTYNGWTIYCTGNLKLDSDGIYIENNEIYWNGQKFELGTIGFTPDGTLREEVVANYEDPKKLALLSKAYSDSKLYQLIFDDDGVSAYIDVDLPAQFNNFTVKFDSVKLYPDNTFNIKYVIPYLYIPAGNGNVSFTFEDITFSNEEFHVSYIEMNIKEINNESAKQSFGGCTINMNGLSISKSKGIEIKGSCTSPFEIWGMVFCIRNLSYEDGCFSFAGSLTLPDSMPEELAGRTVSLTKFKINTNHPEDFELEATLGGEFVIPFLKESGWKLAFNGLTLGHSEDNPFYINFNYTKLIVPSGYGISQVVVTGIKYSPLNCDFVFDGITADFDGATVEMGALDVSLNSIFFENEIVDDATKHKFGFAASAKINAEKGKTFPDIVKNAEISNFRISFSEAGLEDFDISAIVKKGPIYEGCPVELAENAGVSIKKGSSTDDHFILYSTLTLSLNLNGSAFNGYGIDNVDKNKKPTIKSVLEVDFTEINVKKFEGSYKDETGKLISFSVNGIYAGIKEITLNTESLLIEANAGATMSSISTDATARVTVDWSDKVKNDNGDLTGQRNVEVKFAITSGNLTIGDFKAGFNELNIFEDEGKIVMSMKEITFSIPRISDTTQFNTISFTDVKYIPDSDPSKTVFEGTVASKLIEEEVCGFKLRLEDPSYVFEDQEFTFSKAVMISPDFMFNASFGISGVKINSNGFEMDGIAFAMPDFAVGEVGFRNIGAEFSMDKTGKYFISAHGGASIPGAGIIDAELSFTNISDQYPIGIKRAYFSYEVCVGGIPLGNTGLCLSGIRGGLAYGYPDEVPANFRDYFEENGIRIQLGLTVKDQAGGNAVRMKADTWIDVCNCTFAFSGNMTLLAGELNITADAYSVFKKNMFATGMSVELKFVRGNLEVYIFDVGGSLKFSGSASVQFGLPQGTIHVFWWNLPTFDLWLPEIGCKFGDFKNNKRGFLGYVNIKIWNFDFGTVGMFIGKDGVDWNVSSYEILKPESSRSVSSVSRGTTSRSFDMNDSDLINDVTYHVNVKGSKKLLKKTSVSSVNSRAIGDEDIVISDEDTVAKTIYVIAYTEALPDFTLISPSGVEYSAESDELEIGYVDNAILIGIENAEIGDWKINVTNVPSDTYELSVLGVQHLPQVSFNDDYDGTLNAGSKIYVSGTTNMADSSVIIYAAESEESSEFELGILPTDSEGNFAGYVSTSNVNDGNFILCARIAGETDADDSTKYDSPCTYSKMTYCVDRSGISLNTPEDLTVTETDKGEITVRWNNSEENGNRTNGYYLRTKKTVTVAATGEDVVSETTDNIGDLTEISIPNYILYESGSDGDKTAVYSKICLEFSVCCYDAEGHLSPYIASESIMIGDSKSDYNRPVVDEKQITVEVYKGEENKDNSVSVSFENWKDEKTFVTAKLIENVTADEASSEEDKYESENWKAQASNIDITFQTPVLADESGSDIPFAVYASDKCQPGTYTFDAYVMNENNYENKVNFTITVIVRNPVPVIEKVSPDVVDGSTDSKITIYGKGFVDGTRYYLDGIELLTSDEENSGNGTKTLIVPSTVTRGVKSLHAENADGEKDDSQEITIEVEKPGYDISIFMSDIEVEAGINADYILKINSFDGYSENAEFTVVEKTESFIVKTESIPMDSEGYITISVPEGTETGKYETTIKASNGAKFVLKTEVVDNSCTPVISSLKRIRFYSGKSVVIYGYNFGSSGKVYFNDNVVSVEDSKWTESRIEFVIPEDTAAGKYEVYVETENGKSDTISINVYKFGYQVSTTVNKLVLEAGESTSVGLAVTGYADDIKFEINKNPSCPVNVTLSDYVVSTNAMIEMDLEVPADAPNGTWQIQVLPSAEVEREIVGATVTFTVTVTDGFEIITDSIPNGTLSSPYKCVLETSGDTDEIRWKKSSGSLPDGLSLSSSGVISGTPEESGNFTFVVNATKTSGKSLSKVYSLVVEEEYWGMTNKNAGNVNSTDSKVPSVKNESWNYESKEDIDSIYVKSGRIAAVSENSVKILNTSGKLMTNINRGYRKSFVTDNKIIGLTENGTLEALSLYTGLKVWGTVNEHVEDFISNGTVLITKNTEDNSDVFYIVNIESGEKTGKFENGFTDSSKVIWSGNKAYEWSEASICGIYDSDLKFECNSEILNAASDENGFVVVSEDEIYSLDENLSFISSVERESVSNTFLSVDENYVLVTGETGTVLFSRNEYEKKLDLPAAEKAYLASGKVISLKDGIISVVNIYNGKELWEDESSIDCIAVYDQKIYATSGNILRAYSGNYDSYFPETQIQILTEKNTAGEYKKRPVVKIESTDQDDYVTDVYVKVNDGSWQKYADTFRLNAGENKVQAYGVDSEGRIGSVTVFEENVAVAEPEYITVRLYSKLNPGYGYGVYFSGTFKEGENWTVFKRGTYDESLGWYIDVTANSTFEWKSAYSSWDKGETTSTDNDKFIWESMNGNHTEQVEPDYKTVRLYSNLDPGYGCGVYFTGTFKEGDNWTVYKRGIYDESCGWYVDVSANGDFEWKSAYSGWEKGEYTTVNNNDFVWESISGNHTEQVTPDYKTVRIYSSLNPGYGKGVYFSGTFREGDDWNVFIRGTYDESCGWYADVNADGNFEWKSAYSSWEKGETSSTNNDVFTWESSDENHEEEIDE